MNFKLLLVVSVLLHQLVTVNTWTRCMVQKDKRLMCDRSDKNKDTLTEKDPHAVLFGSWEQNPDMGNLWGFYRLHGYYFGDPYISGLAL